MEKKIKTAVQWLLDELSEIDGNSAIAHKALEMEEEQLEHAFFAGGRARHNFHMDFTFQSVEDYIESTYKEK